MIKRIEKGKEIPYDLLLLADETVEAIDKYIHQSDIYVLERDHVAIAVYALQTICSDTAEIKNIAVDTAFQGQGIGQELLKDAITLAKEKGFKRIIIGTGDAGIKQLYLYQKVGFEIYDIKHRFFLDNYPDPIFENGIQLKHMIMLKKEL
ncbi:MAG: GNAT family N-acetyltransferase [Bacteroidetes bacterium]|nr:GNAT family N-acetyltransferase [Bacteroidota bacterium]